MKFISTSVLAFGLLGSIFASAAAIPAGKREAAPVLEGVVPAGVVPDGVVPEGVVPNGVVPDVALPDVALPDVAAPDVSVPDVSRYVVIVGTLITNVKQQTAVINATTAALPDVPTLVESLGAAEKIKGAIATIITLINAAVTDIRAVTGKAGPSVSAAPVPTELVGLVLELVLEISSTLAPVLSALGLASLLSGVLGGLISALTGLLAALTPVVGDLLTLVAGLIQQLPLPVEVKAILSLLGLLL